MKIYTAPKFERVGLTTHERVATCDDDYIGVRFENISSDGNGGALAGCTKFVDWTASDS